MSDSDAPPPAVNENDTNEQPNNNDQNAADDVTEVHDPNAGNDAHSEAEMVDSPGHSSDDDEPVKKEKEAPKAAFSSEPNNISDDFPVDPEILAEIIERRDMDRLDAVYGGVSGFAERIAASTTDGVPSSTIDRRREVFGANVLSQMEPVTFIDMLIEAFSDRVIQILTVAGIVSIIFGLFLPDPHTDKVERETGWIKGVAIIISVMVVTLTGAIQNYNKAKKFEEMEREQSVKNVSVFRDGREQTIQSTELVVGDVLVLETGMEIVCDGLYVSGNELKTNEAPITGEPDLIEKSPEKGDVFLVSGTSVEEGTGMVLVAAVGMLSFQGKLKAQTQSDETGGETPLQEHLTELGDDIGKVGLVGAILLTLALVLKEVILITTDDKTANAATFLGFVIIAITLIAVAIPEGLPLAVTISLAFSMRAMMEQQCMVRVLASCETMGAATAVCSDKTGTLTTNTMTAVQALLAELEFVIDGYGLKPRNSNVREYDRDKMQTIDTSTEIVDKFCFSLAINSTARQQEVDGEMTWVGNKTEAGILSLVLRLGRDYKAARASVDLKDLKQYPFSSAKKRMTTLVRQDNAIVAHTKGASETILEACTHYLDASGSIAKLDDEHREEFNNVIVDMASQGNRTIGVATAACDFDAFPDEEPDLPYVFMGVLGIQDPIRQEVPAAVAACESAHLTVRMVTGDNINTAKAIGAKCGIYDPDADHIAMTGPDFREMYRTDKQALIDLLPRLRVLARSSPTDKFVLVGLLQDEHGEVVGVTGDGTNDAPALKLADVGFAMNTGTDIAKGASDMVLIDDNFATVVTAIKWGRAVNDNIKKFLQYQLAINFAGVGLTIIGSLASPKSKEPIAPVQLLWLNLIMDTLAALSLATELPEEACLTRLPVYKQAPLLTNKLRTFIAVHGGYQLVIILLVLFLGHRWFELSESAQSCKEVGGEQDGAFCQQGRVHSTFLFNMFIWFQIFNVINARKIYGEINCFEGLFTRSRVMVVVFIAVIGLQVFAVEVGGDALSTIGLSWQNWLICIAFGASEWIIGFIVRLIPVENYIPSKEEIVAARREEREAQEAKEREEEEAKVEAAKEAKAQEASETPAPATDSEGMSDSKRNSRRQSRVKIADDHPDHGKRRGTFVSGDASLKRSMSIRKTH